ncbi:MAG: protein-disulfide reductase DsbD domain-containing protein, partial [Gammaproteobacteria bacterium]
MKQSINRHLLQLLFLTLLSLGLGSAWAQGDEDELLDPDDAFAFSAEVVDAESVRATWDIDPRYYLYRGRISFKSSDPAQIELGEPDFPEGKIKNDEFFGEVETYRGKINIEIPLDRVSDAGELVLQARSQGCADAGVCYPPHDQEIVLKLPELTVAQSEPEPTKSGSLNMLSNLANNLAGDDSADDEFLDPEVAFKPNVKVDADGNVTAHWEIADGYYLYKDRLKFDLKEGEGVQLGDAQLSKGKIKDDEFFGKVEVFYKK